MTAEETGAAGWNCTVARAVSRVTTTLVTPGTFCRDSVALRTQFWQFSPRTVNSITPGWGAGSFGSQLSAQAQLIALPVGHIRRLTAR